MEYEKAWELQRGIHQEVADGTRPNSMLILEHPSVFTAGRRTDESEKPTDGTPVINVDRGGKITWHGPGQLVGYPIVKLRNRNDVVGFVREIENALIDACAEFDVKTERYCERSGVWIRDSKSDRKIAAIGIRVAKGVTMHGFALNCNNDLTWFDRIVPCGIRDAGVTTLSKELGRNISVSEVADRAEFHLHRVFGQIANQLSQGLSINA